jgi:hypothetical protein
MAMLLTETFAAEIYVLPVQKDIKSCSRRTSKKEKSSLLLISPSLLI